MAESNGRTKRDPVSGSTMSPSLVDDIAFRLQADILAGVFQPGTHLQQDELRLRYGVSRTPIREALHKLHAQNLVSIVPNKGATVRIPTAKNLEDIFQTRAEMEGFSAELAAANWTSNDEFELLAVQAKLKVFVSIAIDMDDASPESEVGMSTRISSANEEFHSIVHQASGNERLHELIIDLQNSVPVSQVWRALHGAHEAEELNIRDHDAIALALKRGDGKAARDAMSAHIRRAGQLLIGYLDE